MSRSIDDEAQAAGIPPSELTRVAVMHHPTLPVTVAEEVAAFESLTNLALVRLFLARSGFHVLLHGHKHAGTVYTDRIAEFGDTASRREHPLLVVSGPTLSGEQGQTQAAAVLEIETHPQRRSVKLVRIPPVTALPPALPSRLSESECRLWEEEMRGMAPLVLSGRNTAETYGRLLAAFATRGQVRRNLMCIVEHPENADRIPPGYPENLPASGAEARQRWFSETVAWWQRPESKLLDRLHFSTRRAPEALPRGGRRSAGPDRPSRRGARGQREDDARGHDPHRSGSRQDRDHAGLPGVRAPSRGLAQRIRARVPRSSRRLPQSRRCATGGRSTLPRWHEFRRSF